MGQISVTIPRLRLQRGRYFWRPTPAVKALGFAAEPLGADLETAIGRAKELNEQVNKALAGETPPPQPATGSIAALIALYESDPSFTKLAEKTKRGYGRILREIERKAGHVAVKGLTRADMKATYRGLQPRGLATAAAHMRVWRIILGLAKDEAWIEQNPAERMRLTTPPARQVTWRPDQVAAFCAKAIEEKVPSLTLAMLLAYELWQREGDVLTLPWSSFDGSGFDVVQNKTGQRVYVPAPPSLLRAMADAPKTSTVIVVSEATGRPYKESHFQHEVRRIRDLAKLPATLQFRDLRRTAATEAGDGGATDRQLMAVGGWKTPAMVSIYVRPSAEQAGQAVEKRERLRAKVAKGVATK